jgi:hypothetical protein
MEEVAEVLRPIWEATEAAEIQPQERTEWLSRIEENLPLADHWHWRRVYERTFVDIFNSEMWERCFGILKAIDGLEFGSAEWRAALVEFVQREFPIGDMHTDKFWVSLAKIPADAWERYKEMTFPFLSVQQNARLKAARSDKARWLKNLIAMYAGYWRRVADIYWIVNPNDESQPKYKIIRSLAIAADQRVFLVENIEDLSRRVVKWEAETNSALLSWKLVRRAGVEMMKFKTKYQLSPMQPVLLMEVLVGIDGSDDMYELLLDVLPQLQSLHRAGFVHADLKLDNIMKRPEPRKYLIIDYDSISRIPIKGIDNAVRRMAYSPWWTTQVPGQGYHPTSYRYDLEELFYAVGDLAKLKLHMEKGANFKVDKSADAVTRWRAQYQMETFVRDIHSSWILLDKYLTGLFPLIMNLPERLPFAEIDHSSLVEYVRMGIESGASARTSSTCAICASITSCPVDTVNPEGAAVQVCGMRCAALVNPELHEGDALAYREATKCVRMPVGCVACGEVPQYRCPKCRLRYCSSTCYDNHDDHKLVCK